jgi:hypothetical protein
VLPVVLVVTPMLNDLTTRDWMQVIQQTACEVATVALGFEECVKGRENVEIGSGLCGAYLPLSTTTEQIQVGLLADDAGCQALAKALLGMEQAEPDLSVPDMSDSFAEIVNLLAGGLKRRLEGRVDLKLGLPLFVSGVVRANSHITILATELRLGSVEVVVLLVMPSAAAYAPVSRA